MTRGRRTPTHGERMLRGWMGAVIGVLALSLCAGCAPLPLTGSPPVPGTALAAGTPRPATAPCEPAPGVVPQSPAEINRGLTRTPRIALTFDAEIPSASTAPLIRILRILAKHHIHSTFFVEGQWAAKYPAVLSRVLADGHEIGNHTWDHPHLQFLSSADLCREITRADQLLTRLTGHTTRPWFRAPFNTRNVRIRALAAHLGYRTVYWTIDTLDWAAGATPAKIQARVLGWVGNGAIILMHTWSKAEADGLDHLLAILEQRGYQMVTVSQVLQQSAGV